ncbi:MAG: vWA domain-containing protein [Roseovarius sp.]
MTFFPTRALALATTLLAAPAALANDNVMVVFDGSNSMWGQIDGTAKIEIARNVIDNLLGDWADDRSVGLMAYGHRARGDCTDIEVIVEPGAAQRSEILNRIKAITPTGKTPLTDAVEEAATRLSYTDRPATVVLISDGLESCERDPCELARALEKGGVGFTAHVVGFGLGADEDTASLSCIAEETGGQYIQASNAVELGAALSAVATAVATPEPDPEPEPQAPQVAVDAPDTTVAGSMTTITWEPTVDEADYIAITPVGAAGTELGQYLRIGRNSALSIAAPGEPGAYEARYYNTETKTVLGTDPLEVTEAQVTLQAPDTVQTGSPVTVSWSPTINPRDYIAIVPAGSEPGTLANYRAANKHESFDLTSPADPGLYEIRYILNVDSRTIASRPIEVTDPQVTLQAPETALTGADIPVSWSGTVNEKDYITIVPAGTDEGDIGNYFMVRGESDGSLLALADPGLHEIRYVQREGGKTLASAPIELLTPEVTITGPESAATGAGVEVSWTGTVNTRDYIAIAPVGADAGTYGSYQMTRDADTVTLTMPSDPGLYELRYVLREGPRVLATAMIEVTEPQVTVAGPETVATGAEFSVSWTGTINPQDYVTIVPVGAEPKTFGSYKQVRDDTETSLTAPADPGMYELRYLLREGPKVMATAMIEVTQPDVTVSGPQQARAGDEMTVEWSGTVSANDYVNLVQMGAEDGRFGAYFTVREATSGKLTAPDDPGMYELRYLLREGTRVLARHTVEILPADAALNTGAALTAPDTAAPGSTIDVGWQVDSTSTDQRITLARGNQAIFTWLQAVRITDGVTTAQIDLPSEPGVYELRFLDVAGQQVLARKVITVE